MGHGGGGASTSGSHVKDTAIDLIAGTFGGIANVYAGQPLDTVKVKVQTFPHLYSSSLKCFTDTFRLDGVRGLYAGTVPALAANVAENAVLFGAYGVCQKAVAKMAGRTDLNQMTIPEKAVSGSLAAVFAAMVLCPTELVKCKLQAAREVDPTKKISPMSVCKDIWKERGPRGYFVGLSPTLAREVPGYFFFFGVYEMCRNLLTPKGTKKEDIGLTRTAISGGVGGMALWASIFPADVIKSRMQVTGEGKFGQMLVKIYREEGIGALYKGLAPTLLRTCVASGCLFIAVEESRKIMHAFF